MVIPFKAGRVWRRQEPPSSVDDLAVVLKQRHILARVTVFTASCLWILILTVIALARTQPVATVELLAQLQPRGPLPHSGHCLLPHGRYDECQVDWDGKVVDVTFDSKTRAMIRILIPGQPYAISDLLLAWGTPTGISRLRYGCSITIMWSTRAAHLFTCTLLLSSHIDFLEYALAQPLGPVWRGFT